MAASREMSPAVSLLRGTLVPLFLVACCPPFAMLLWHTHTQLGGSLSALFAAFGEQGVGGTIAAVWGPVVFGSWTAWAMIALYVAFEVALMRLLPGKTVEGPVTPAGDVPVYKANGLAAFAVTVGLYCVASFGLGLFSPAVLYDRLGELLGALNLGALVLCALLVAKGRLRPSSRDAGSSGNLLFDYYWGMELFPRVLGVNLKHLTNCRLAMMGWPLLLISFAAKQAELGGLTDGMVVAVGLQLFYIAKFFLWEMGYMASLDIMHDRAGFYIVWGVLVWLPSVYTASTLYLVNQPHELGWPLSLAVAALGVAAIVVNYLADAQRRRVRDTKGETTVWGRKPAVIVARYRTQDGQEKENLLLVSGFWGVSRHFHYLPEILGAVCWTLPVMFDHLLPWFYVIFLTILLTDRAFRDDRRCAEKYGPYWEQYRDRVPYKIVPGLL